MQNINRMDTDGQLRIYVLNTAMNAVITIFISVIDFLELRQKQSIKCCARLHEHLTSTATTRKFVFEFMAGDVILPSKLKKPCVYPACPALVTGRYCEEHD